MTATRTAQKHSADALDLDRLRDRMDLQARSWGRLVRERRKKLGLSLLQLAALIGVPFQTISKVERGDIVPRDYLKAALALRLATEMDELFPWPAREDLAVAS